ncbi:MAG: TlpA family protein disulfide reductase [Dehalococcoidia bacterium]
MLAHAKKRAPAVGLLVAGLLLAAGGVFLLGRGGDEASADYGVTGAERAAEGDPAPDFVLEDTRTGRAFTLSEFRGKPLLVNFSATWCVTCVAEFRNFEQAQQVMGDRGQILVVDYHQPRQIVLDLIVPLKIDNVPVLLDTDGEVTDHYRVQGLPTTILVDADGTVIRVGRGYMSPQVIRDAFADLGLQYDLPAGE